MRTISPAANPGALERVHEPSADELVLFGHSHETLCIAKFCLRRKGEIRSRKVRFFFCDTASAKNYYCPDDFVCDEILRLDIRKAPGVDGITPRMLKETKAYATTTTEPHLPPDQFGFRPKQSTEDALLIFEQSVMKAMDECDSKTAA